MKQGTKTVRLPRSDTEANRLIVRVAVWLAVGLFGTVGLLLAVPRGNQGDQMSVPKVAIAVDIELAEKGREMFTVTYGCTSCHAVKEAKVSGQATGPDLSGAMLAWVSLGQVNPIAQWFKEQGLKDPAAEPEKAADLLAKFLQSPPPYAKTMVSQTKQYMTRPGGEKAWKETTLALVEFLKTTVAKPPESGPEEQQEAGAAATHAAGEAQDIRR
ncbi:MAG: c-type cytochrome [Armatimonadetes bacterium]|nr:c-type cytochrome [Armatimonadota bacterium]